MAQSATLSIKRVFTKDGVHPYDALKWKEHTAKIDNPMTGEVAFEQKRVEFPDTWSLNAVNIVSQKYFAGTPGSKTRERSLKQLIDRVADTITRHGEQHHYFIDEEEAELFNHELKAILVNQRAAFNSPVWFNIGVEDRTQQASACFILSVDDTMPAILNWYTEEGMIFKGGSGSGINLSKIRSSKEGLGNSGGKASGPVSFMRGADASAGTIKSGGKTRRAAKMVVLNVEHPDVEEFIWTKQREEQKARVLEAAGFDMGVNGDDSFSVQYQNANNSVRITDEFMKAVENDEIWEYKGIKEKKVVGTIKARDLWRQIAQAAWECADPGLQFDTTINDWHTAPNKGRINASNPCSEYMHIDNSACNLASINLLKYLTDDGQFMVEEFKHTVEILITAQDILVGYSSYPTQPIDVNARAYRQLGLGYANLGALLMAQGLPYDSDEGRAQAAAITAIMTGHAYATSSRIAKRVGTYSGFDMDSEAMLNVLKKHRSEVSNIDASLVAEEVLSAAAAAWEEAVDLSEKYGVRNSQATVLAPTGTISFMMDCDTTGIEPDLSLVKFKKLVGGGNMIIVNHTVPRALKELGYTKKQVDSIVDHIDKEKTIVGAEHLKEEHLPVFACSMGDNTIHYNGHIKMMGATQPFISGAISKTVNLPETATVEDVEALHMESWKLGIKAIAIYRDNCKVGQPLSTKQKDDADDDAPAAVADNVTQHNQASGFAVSSPVRRELTKSRSSRTYEFKVSGTKGFVTVGEFEDGTVGEVFIRVAKQGSTLAGVMDSFAISVSYGLQYGVPLKAYVKALTNMAFAPSGVTDDSEIKTVTSLTDYIMRRLALDYLSFEDRLELGLARLEDMPMDDAQPTLDQVVEATEPQTTLDIVAPVVEPVNTATGGSAFQDSSAPLCTACGNQTQRSGACYVCTACGSSTGCG